MIILYYPNVETDHFHEWFHVKVSYAIWMENSISDFLCWKFSNAKYELIVYFHVKLTPRTLSSVSKVI